MERTEFADVFNVVSKDTPKLLARALGWRMGPLTEMVRAGRWQNILRGRFCFDYIKIEKLPTFK